MSEVVTKPISIPFPDAFRRLSISRDTLRGLVDRGVFTMLPADRVPGPGKPVFLLLAEVEEYDRTRSEAAVKAFREKAAADLHPVDVGGDAGGA